MCKYFNRFTEKASARLCKGFFTEGGVSKLKQFRLNLKF